MAKNAPSELRDERVDHGNESLPSGEDETAKGGEKDPGLEPWMNIIHRLKIIPNFDRNRIVNRPESRDSGEVLAFINVGVKVNNGERLVFQLRKNTLL